MFERKNPDFIHRCFFPTPRTEPCRKFPQLVAHFFLQNTVINDNPRVRNHQLQTQNNKP